jgi:hypothetical protein
LVTATFVSRACSARPSTTLFPNHQAAEKWAAELINWHNYDHLRGVIRFISPADRHMGQDTIPSKRGILSTAKTGCATMPLEKIT